MKLKTNLAEWWFATGWQAKRDKIWQTEVPPYEVRTRVAERRDCAERRLGRALMREMFGWRIKSDSFEPERRGILAANFSMMAFKLGLPVRIYKVIFRRWCQMSSTYRTPTQSDVRALVLATKLHPDSEFCPGYGKATHEHVCKWLKLDRRDLNRIRKMFKPLNKPKPDSGTDSKKNREVLKSAEVTAADGAPGVDRTHDQLIKSQING